MFLEKLKVSGRRAEFGATVLGVSICAMIANGLIGVGRNNGGFGDVRYWYVSAKVWLAGLNPYDLATFQNYAQSLGVGEIESFAYPPQSFAIGAFLSIFPFSIAQIVMTAFSLISVFALAFWGVELLKSREAAAGIAPSQAARWLIPAIIVGNPFTAHVLWTGQVSLIITAWMITSWQLIQRRNWLLGGVLTGLASVKPQLVLLPILWLVLERRWRALVTAGVSILGFSAIPLLVTGPQQTLKDWLQATQGYQLEPTKSSVIGLTYNMNLKSLLQGLGIQRPSLAIFLLVAFVLTIALWQLRHRFDRSEILGLLLALSIFLIVGRDYDLVLLVPILSALWWHLRDSTAHQVLAFAAMSALFIPHRFMSRLNLPLLLYWRTIIYVGLALWLFQCAFSDRDTKIKSF